MVIIYCHGASITTHRKELKPVTNQNEKIQLEELAELLKEVPPNMRAFVAYKISGIIEGAKLAADIEAQKMSA